MELSRRALDYWGLAARSEPFGNTLKDENSVFVWPEFESAVESLLGVIERRQIAALVGSTCSAKTTIWQTVQHRMREHGGLWSCCQPVSKDPAHYNETCLLRAVKESILPEDGTRTNAFRRDRESRARQVRQLLEGENARRNPVTLAIDNAQDCGISFLLLCKRIWDDVYGYDRLLSMIFIGHAGLATMIAKERELAERAQIIRAPGLGEHLGAYLQFELARCACNRPLFEDNALEELAKLEGNGNWLSRRDHPLIVNNIVSRALQQGFHIKAKSVGRDLVAEAMKAEG